MIPLCEKLYFLSEFFLHGKATVTFHNNNQKKKTKATPKYYAPEGLQEASSIPRSPKCEI
jgi:hypothetical protein